MFRYILSIITTIFCFSYLKAQSVPTTYQAAQKIGEAKLAVLQKSNSPAVAHYVVLKKGRNLGKLLKYDNSVYVIDSDYDLKGKLLVVPKNSVLVFRNGTIRNGTLQSNDGRYAIMKGKKVVCEMEGSWKEIAPIFAASELGLTPNSIKARESNYAKLQSVINRGLNIYLDGRYYILFPRPLLLNYEMHFYGGEILFSKHAFDLADGGGVYANGVHFSSISGSKTDDIVCGTREKHRPITTGPITFLNCHFSCNRVVSLEFEYANPLKKMFGIHSLLVGNCYADHTAKFIVLDAPFINRCSFQNNIFTNFSHAPIYLAHNHSVRTHPNEANTNPWTEEIVQTGCDVVIDSNVFIGKEVQEPSYYCAALVIARKCSFINNYLKDIVNYSDKNAKGYTAYDAYLSCAEVDYENNYVENMMSYAKDGASKPQTEIGKSKVNPLDVLGYKAYRRYINNIFICDGSKFHKKGADVSSITSSIFNNYSPIHLYVWNNNVVIYKDIILVGRSSSSKYGSFKLENNYFECSKLTGNLVFSNSAYDVSIIDISNNTFNLSGEARPVVFNQAYKDNNQDFKHGNINISCNTFLNSAPIYHYSVADTVRINNNKVQKLLLDGNLYLNDYTGSPHPLKVSSLEAEIDLNADNPQGGVIQYFSDASQGTFASSFTSIPKRGITYHYLIGRKHVFTISLNCNGEMKEIVFENDGKTCYYLLDGERIEIKFGKTAKKVWYRGNGVVLITAFIKGNNNDIQTSLITESGNQEGKFKLTYTSLK